MLPYCILMHMMKRSQPSSLVGFKYESNKWMDENGQFNAVTEVIHQFEWRQEPADSSEDKILDAGFLGSFRSYWLYKVDFTYIFTFGYHILDIVNNYAITSRMC